MKNFRWLGLAALVLSGAAQAASFDCAKAQSKVEKVICADAELSKLDEAMTVAYREAQLHANDASSLTKIQRLWLAARNLCPDANCVQDIYAKRLSALRSNSLVGARLTIQTQARASGSSSEQPAVATTLEQRESVFPCMSVDECRAQPVRVETLGANWHYKRDADKLPAIRNALASGKLKAPADELSGKNVTFCSMFREDFLNGRNVQAIEPDYEVLSVDDSRLEPWMNPKNCPDNDDVKRDSVFVSLGLDGVPPYRFYHLEVDGNMKNGKEDVVLYREAGNGYSQRYEWVDLKQCLIKEVHQVSSPQSRQFINSRDALGLLISYRGRSMVLQYRDSANQNEVETRNSGVRLFGFNPVEFCHWDEPFKP